MSADSLDHLARDLRSYLKQQRDDGTEWYFDEGPPAGEAPTVVTKAAAPTPEPAAAPTAAPPPAAAPQPETTEFEAVCDTFVRETLEQIRKYQQRPAEPREQDMFAAPDEAPAALSSGDKAEALAAMAAEVAACEACKLHPTRTNTVFGVGNPDAGVVFVGEAPGRHEDEQGEPFVGRAGKLLNDILKAIGFAREDVYICNILKCRPPKNRDPERDEVDACEPFLKRQLEILQPKVICCPPPPPPTTLLDTRASLGNLRQAVHFYEGIPVMATYHPAALLRNPHWKRDTWDDVRKLRALHDALLEEAAP